MASDSPPSPAVAGRDIAVGISGKSSPVGAVAGGGDEICKNGQSPPPCAVGVECLLHPSVPVAATEDNITVSTAVAGDGPNVGSGCGLHVGVGAGISSDGSNGHSSTDSAVIESDYPDLQPQDTNLVLETGNLERGTGFESPIDPVNFETINPFLALIPRSRLSVRLLPEVWRSDMGNFAMLGGRLFETGNLEEGTGIDFGSPISMGGTPVLPPVNENGFTAFTRSLLGAFGFTSVPNSMGGTPVLPLVYVEGEGGRLLPGIDFASLPISMGGTSVFYNVEGGHIGHMLAGIDSASLISMGGTVIQTGNVEGGRIRRMLAGIGLASPISMGDTLVIQTGDVEAGYLLTGSRLGVGRSDITPMNDDFRMYIVNAEPQSGNYPPPLEMSGDNSHLVRLLEQHLRSNCFVILLVTSEILGMVFEIIYQESHIMPYFVIWIVCVTIVMYAARRLAMIEGGMANREQFAVYSRCLSFFLLELLQYWGIHQGNYVTALKIILKVTGAVIGWWVVGVLQSYMDAFGMHLPLRRRED
ncbi:PREDICTED: uncharacterized protein LOC101300088 [Fragaria vesca subsp. vesca]|uniref:uncharacterized protein LOC101300088 n=1 Tax=Fragaria vesca subsp. vesca TaxID=101020 RepID=UPI0002C30CA6|nr:PREDICTED: uncharacterized protein LOC101300088 [Fragaria vesca subsp. vesca]